MQDRDREGGEYCVNNCCLFLRMYSDLFVANLPIHIIFFLLLFLSLSFVFFDIDGFAKIYLTFPNVSRFQVVSL